MSYEPVHIENWGGLQLDRSFEEVGLQNCVSMLNIDLTEAGHLRPRWGSFKMNAATAASGTSKNLLPIGTMPTTSDLVHLRLSGGVLVLDNPTSLAAATITGYTSITDWLAAGTITYITYPGQTIRYLTTSTQNALSGKPGYCGVTPWDNRLVQGYFLTAADSPTGASGSTSTVFFSAPNNGASWGATDWINLGSQYGDICGMATFGDLLIVAQEECLNVFYGVSVDATGGPIFNFRRLFFQGKMTSFLAGKQIVAGTRGVYFSTTKAIYRTDGQSIENVSTPISMMFAGTTGSTSTNLWTGTLRALSFADGRLFAQVTFYDSAIRHLVYDETLDQWMVWDLASTAPEVLETGVPGEIMWASTYKILKAGAGAANDDGTTITSSYTSGGQALGAPGSEAVMREARAFYTGSPTFAVATNLGAFSSATAFTTGSGSRGYYRTSARGQYHQYKLAGTGAWDVRSLTLMSSGSRDVGAL